MGEEGSPQGVEMEREATWVKPGSSRKPVPPITAMGTGPGGLFDYQRLSREVG